MDFKIPREEGILQRLNLGGKIPTAASAGGITPGSKNTG
jgi:hypothetical protein